MGTTDRQFEINTSSLLYLKWLTKDLPYSMGNSAQCYVAARMGGELGGGWIHVHACLSPFAVHQKLAILLTDYTPIKNKKLKKERKPKRYQCLLYSRL